MNQLNSHDSYFDDSIRRNEYLIVPKYYFPEEELLNNETVLEIRAIKLNLGNTKPQLDISEDDKALTYHDKTKKKFIRYIHPYYSYTYDGVVVITNQRIIFRFCDQYKSYNEEFDIDKIRLKLENFTKKEDFIFSNKLADINKDIFFTIENSNLKFFLLKGKSGGDSKSRRNYSFMKSYKFGNLLTYVYFSEMIEEIRRNPKIDYNEIKDELLEAYTDKISALAIISGIIGYILVFIVMSNIFNSLEENDPIGTLLIFILCIFIPTGAAFLIFLITKAGNNKTKKKTLEIPDEMLKRIL